MENGEFRKGVGAIILNKNNEILAFNRADFSENWQGIEGGVQEGETTLEALYRELFEETNIPRDSVSIVKKTEKPVKYLFPSGVSFGGYVGQEKEFFLIKIIDDFDDFRYDNVKDEVEFSGCKVMKVEELWEKVPTFKKDIYGSVLREFGLM
jgi:putative (di)nucleoside polyphosphate hydrolase